MSAEVVALLFCAIFTILRRDKSINKVTRWVLITLLTFVSLVSAYYELVVLGIFYT